MKASRLFCIFALVAGLFVANSAGAAAPGCDTVIGPATPASVSVPDATDARASGHVPGTDMLCAVECAQSGSVLAQPLAASIFESSPAVAPAATVATVRFEVASLRVPLPPQVVGPPLTILFGNFRN